MKIAVIILNYNSSADCRKCIGFLSQQENVELEIIVVDNCSRPDDRELLRGICLDANCTLLENRENCGYNAGNNIGLRYAAGKGYCYAMITNPDMEFVNRDYLARLLECFRLDYSIVSVGSDITGIDGTHQNPMRRDGNWRESFGWLAGIFSGKRKKRDTNLDFQTSHYANKISGCCLMVRMDFVRSIGFFDEGTFLYCEEAIWARQVETAKKRIYYVADTYAIHAHFPAAKGNPVKRFNQWKRSRLYFIKKYSGDRLPGRLVSYLSVYVYTFLFILGYFIRKR